MTQRRVAVVGLYRSGSSFWAGILHCLGVDMGAPYWENDIFGHPDNHYEPCDLSIDLQRMWNEPLGECSWSHYDRQRVLRKWVESRAGLCGAKHPLFCLMIEDLISAWGNDLVTIWSYRPIEDSVDSLLRTTFPWSKLEMYSIQHKLWRASHEYFRERPPSLKVNLFDLDEHGRASMVDRIVELLGITPTPEQYNLARSCFRLTDRGQ